MPIFAPVPVNNTCIGHCCKLGPPGLWTRLAQGAEVLEFYLKYSWCALVHDVGVCACYNVFRGGEENGRGVIERRGSQVRLNEES
jgi:hypothetical protein